MERRKTPPAAAASLTTRYLVAYNTLSALLWSVVLARTLLALAAAAPTTLYGSTGTFTKYTQTLAVLEIAHVALGLLRTSLPTTTVQVSSRLLLVWLVCDRFRAPQTSVAYASMLLAWSVTEVCRYSYYVVSLAGARSPLLAWARYNTFFVLYPLGAGSEAWCLFRALPEAHAWGHWWYWGGVAVLVTYAPGLANQYSHMVRQRRKNMRGKKKA